MCGRQENSNVEVYLFSDTEDIQGFLKKIDNAIENNLLNLISEMNYPLTVVYEADYIDRVFRDTYYTYFSRKFIPMMRNCQRLTFFSGEYSYEDFLEAAECQDLHEKLEEALLGTIIIKPTRIDDSNCSMGRCLLDPFKFEKTKRYYLRTTSFTISILGNEYNINAFPSSGQDGETMSCSETCVWEVMEYFGSRYPYYRTVLPGEIINNIDQTAKERVLPTQGLTYEQVTNLLKSFGFEPKLYSKKAYVEAGEEQELSWGNVYCASPKKVERFRKIFHYYVESAIPVIVGIRGQKGAGHSIVCIGHGKIEHDKELSALQQTKYGNYKFLDSDQFVNDYVFVDDNHVFYSIEKFDEFSISNSSDGIRKVAFFAVPLYKHVFLEADGANVIFDEFLSLVGDYLQGLLEGNNNDYLIKRVFLATSNNYKRYHLMAAKSLDEKFFYAQLNYPKMIWVCEICDYERWKNENDLCVIGEIVLDATASNAEKLNSILEVRFGKHVAHCTDNSPLEGIFDQLQQQNDSWQDYLPCYRANLKKGG